MSAPTKLALYAALLAAVFVASFGVGRVVADDDGTPDDGPVATTTTTVAHGDHRSEP